MFKATQHVFPRPHNFFPVNSAEAPSSPEQTNKMPPRHLRFVMTALHLLRNAGAASHAAIVLLGPWRATTTAGGPDKPAYRLGRTTVVRARRSCVPTPVLLRPSGVAPSKPLASCLAPRVRIVGQFLLGSMALNKKRLKARHPILRRMPPLLPQSSEGEVYVQRKRCGASAASPPTKAAAENEVSDV